MANKKPKAVGTAIQPGWHASHGHYLGGRSWIDGADETAIEMEEKWGRGRLRLLVPNELREKFDRQRYLFHQAISHGDLETVRLQSGRMTTAWLALDKAATASGRPQADPRVIETTLPDGTVAAIVPDNAPSVTVHGDGRALSVYTAAEIGRLLAGFPAIARAKEVFPGAEVVAVRSRGDPLDAFDSSAPSLDCPLPFFDDPLDEDFR